MTVSWIKFNFFHMLVLYIMYLALAKLHYNTTNLSQDKIFYFKKSRW